VGNPDERDRHRVGAYAVARAAAGGVGGEAEGLERRRGLLTAADQQQRGQFGFGARRDQMRIV